MYTSGFGVDKCGQAFNVGRQEFFQRPVFQDQGHYGMAICQCTESLFICGILFFTFPGPVVNFQSVVQNEPQLLWGRHVQCGIICVIPDLLFNLQGCCS